MLNTLIFVVCLLAIAICGVIRFNDKMADENVIVAGLIVLGAIVFFRPKFVSMFPFSLIGLLGIVIALCALLLIGEFHLIDDYKDIYEERRAKTGKIKKEFVRNERQCPRYLALALVEACLIGGLVFWVKVAKWYFYKKTKVVTFLYDLLLWVLVLGAIAVAVYAVYCAFKKAWAGGIKQDLEDFKQSPRDRKTMAIVCVLAMIFLFTSGTEIVRTKLKCPKLPSFGGALNISDLLKNQQSETTAAPTEETTDATVVEEPTATTPTPTPTPSVTEYEVSGYSDEALLAEFGNPRNFRGASTLSEMDAREKATGVYDAVTYDVQDVCEEMLANPIYLSDVALALEEAGIAGDSDWFKEFKNSFDPVTTNWWYQWVEKTNGTWKTTLEYHLIACRFCCLVCGLEYDGVAEAGQVTVKVHFPLNPEMEVAYRSETSEKYPFWIYRAYFKDGSVVTFGINQLDYRWAIITQTTVKKNPTPTPTPKKDPPASTPTPVPTQTPTPVPTQTPTPTPKKDPPASTPTPVPTQTPTPVPTQTPTPTPTPTPVPEKDPDERPVKGPAEGGIVGTPTPTPAPGETPAPTATPQPRPQRTAY